VESSPSLDESKADSEPMLEQYDTTEHSRSMPVVLNVMHIKDELEMDHQTPCFEKGSMSWKAFRSTAPHAFDKFWAWFEPTSEWLRAKQESDEEMEDGLEKDIEMNIEYASGRLAAYAWRLHSERLQAVQKAQSKTMVDMILQVWKEDLANLYRRRLRLQALQPQMVRSSFVSRATFMAYNWTNRFTLYLADAICVLEDGGKEFFLGIAEEGRLLGCQPVHEIEVDSPKFLT
jgi:hypothetical protein